MNRFITAAIASFLICAPAFAAKAIIISGSASGGGPRAHMVVTPEGNGISIDEAGVRFAAQQGVRFAAEGRNYTVALSPKTGATGTFQLRAPVIELDEAARKLTTQVEGYQLYLAAPGFRITVSDAGVVEFAINEEGVKFIEGSTAKMAITEQGMPKSKPSRNTIFSVLADSDGFFEIAIREQGVK